MYEQKNENSNNENIQSERFFVSDIIIQHDDFVTTNPKPGDQIRLRISFPKRNKESDLAVLCTLAAEDHYY